MINKEGKDKNSKTCGLNILMNLVGKIILKRSNKYVGFIKS